MELCTRDPEKTGSPWRQNALRENGKRKMAKLETVRGINGSLGEEKLTAEENIPRRPELGNIRGAVVIGLDSIDVLSIL